jgi:6-phosphogluconolactonase
MARTLLLIGSLSVDDAPGFIRICDFDAARGTVSELETAVLQNPSFLALPAGGRTLYSVDEVVDGALCAYALDSRTGKLTAAGRVKSHGDWPCHIRLDRTGRYAFVANFGQWDAASEGAQQLAVVPLGTDGVPHAASTTRVHTGTLGPNKPKQDRPHAHCTLVSGDNRFAIVTDFGFDSIFVYPFDAGTGRLGEARACRLPPGSAPRTLAWGPDGKTIYASLELSSGIAKLSFYPDTGTLSVIGIASSLPAGTSVENFPAELRVSPDGRFAYLGNRGHESIGVFALDGDTPRLIAAHPTGGSWPRCLSLTPDGQHLVVANQLSGDIRLFSIDRQTGLLSGGAEIARAPAPAFVDVVTI